jgi:hypothetical protein
MPDFDKLFVMDCDASGTRFGAVLHQGHGPLDQRLSTVPQHQWISKLFGFDFTIEYHPGHLNMVADALSRRDTEAVVEDAAPAGAVLCIRSGPTFAFIDDIRRATATAADA